MTADPRHRSILLDGPVSAAGGGLRIAVKDCIDVAGQVTACGSRALAGAAPATSDAIAVARLRDAGHTIAARTNMHELAYGVTGVNVWTGTPINPHYQQLVPGGSSSGSAAAVAAGLVDFALGTDTGGSIRVPAACCGVVGFKPSFGRVSRAGVLPVISSLDCVGPLARDVVDIERAMALIVSDWDGDVAAPERPKLGWFSPIAVNPQISTARQAAARVFTLEDIDITDFDAANDAGLHIIGRETHNACAGLLDSGLIGCDVRDRLQAAGQVTDHQIERAEAVREAFSIQLEKLFERFAALALPTMIAPIATLDDVAGEFSARDFTFACRPFNLSGHPAIALPVGEVDGRPVSLQLVGRRGGDEALCALARQIPLFEKEPA